MNLLKITTLLVLVIVNLLTLFGSEPEFICGSTETIIQRATSDRGGLYMTAEGNLPVVVVFIQFKDDWNTSNGWPTNLVDSVMSLPSWASNFLGQGNGITQYYDEMSGSVLNLTGYLHPQLYITQYNESHYSSLGEVNNEVLINLDSLSNFAFSDYDNWNLWCTPKTGQKNSLI